MNYSKSDPMTAIYDRNQVTPMGLLMHLERDFALTLNGVLTRSLLLISGSLVRVQLGEPLQTLVVQGFVRFPYTSMQRADPNFDLNCWARLTHFVNAERGGRRSSRNQPPKASFARRHKRSKAAPRFVGISAGSGACPSITVIAKPAMSRSSLLSGRLAISGDRGLV